jgi:arylsulfatase A-like enzyme
VGGPLEGQLPVPRDWAAYDKARRYPPPRPASFDETAVRDKPPTIRRLPRLSKARTRQITERWRCTLAAMRRVDLDIGRLIGALRRSGQLAHTVIMYLSDNGYYFGEHRIAFAKGWPYEPGLNVPFAVRAPGLRPGTEPRIVDNEDLAPTMLQYARWPCTGCRPADGASLLPLLGGRGSWPTHRGVLVELNEQRSSSRECNCRYRAIRTQHYLYTPGITYAPRVGPAVAGGAELYDLSKDPGELRNVADKPAYAEVRRSLERRRRHLLAR